MSAGAFLLASMLATDPVDAAASAACVVKGSLVENATIYDAAKGGQPIADIVGAARSVQVSDFQLRAQRLRLVSTKSTPTLRVEGFVDVMQMPIGLVKDVSVLGNVLAIPATTPVRVAQSGGTIMVEPRTPTFDGVEASVSCAELQVVREKAAPSMPPASTMLLPIHKAIDLFGLAGGTPVTTLRISGAPSNVSLYGYETLNGYVHVRFADDVVIDGWMRRSDLTEKGFLTGGCIGSIGGLGMWGTSASSSYAQRDTEVRLGDKGPRVGVLEKGARVVRWGTGQGAWTQIRIYDADANEPPGKAFYVREDDLGPSAP